MKIGLIAILVCCSSIIFDLIHSFNTDNILNECQLDTVEVEGYYVSIINKKKLKKIIKEKKGKLKGRNFKVYIDEIQYDFFIPIDDLIDSSLSSTLENIDDNPLKDLFIDCKRNSATDFYYYLCKVDNPNNNCDWPEVLSGTNYYELPGRQENVFKISKMKGIWLAKKVSMAEFKSRRLLNAVGGKGINYHSSNLDSFRLHIFYRKTYFEKDPELKREGFSIWKKKN